MKVIMLKDVKGVATRDSMKDVSDGYALNFLIAQGLAVQATPAKIAEFEARQKTQSAAHDARERELTALTERLREVRIPVKAKANASGHLYTQLSPKLIIEALKQELHIDLPMNAVVLSNPIKQVGDSAVSMKFGAHTVTFTVSVVAEK